MASAQEVEAELLGTNAPAGHHDLVVHKGGPGQTTVRTVQAKVTFAADEGTKWLEGRSLDHEAIKKFLADPNRKDTVLGHAINAASLARINHLILVRLAEAMDVNISGIK